MHLPVEIVAALILVLTGSVANGLWTIHNLHVRSELQKIVEDLKDFIRKELEGYVTKDLFNERGREIQRRLDAIGA